MNLVIVESPSKAKTIQKYLGDDYSVTSSMGHIRDLPGNDKAIDIANNFTPHYEISEDKRKLVADLRKKAKAADLVWLATDEDREGEAIAWHLMEALELDPARVKRIVFHEITKQAILNAIKNPRSVDTDLVDAQQARRVLDRLVGYGLSPVLWRKVQRNLSAGRVQSVAVRLVVEREREIQQFSVTSQFRVLAEFTAGGKNFTAELPHRFDTEEQAYAFLEACKGATFTVNQLETKPSKKSPSAPFTTSTLQQEASRKLGLSLARTMKLAQDLYEGGHITYMRTDSVNLSDVAISATASHVSAEYGQEYSSPRKYTTKVASAQEAHEAIRPTDVLVRGAGETDSHRKLYELIWKRTVASQMSDAQLEKTTATISISTLPDVLVATGEVMVFDGFLKVYMEGTDDDGEKEDAKMLPALTVGQQLPLEVLRAQERFSRPPSRFTEASLVKKLEELGIGRPSTYAPTISTIQSRNYVVKEDRDGRERTVRELVMKGALVSTAIERHVSTEITGAERNKLFPTDIGGIVTDFLLKHFEDIMDYNFTATVEKQFDEIAEGARAWNAMIAEFYGPFKETLDRTSEHADRQSGERILGTDPRTGKPVSVRLARYGPIAQIGDADDPNKQQKGLPASQSMETITLEDALELFKFPRVLGDYQGKPIAVKVGRFGPYVDHDGTFASIPKGEDPLTITEERAIELVENRRKMLAERTLKEFPENPEVQILKGRWGPFLKIGKKNIRLPKDVDVASMTLEQCLALDTSEATASGKKTATDQEKPAKKAAKKTAAKKTTARKTAAKKSTSK
ncbi:MAG: type I DNA topoisomerase [Bradyrhizobiaceae bacterium]|nr:type I DNA topoisomerase [Bradyrhizobiaceae bacterium]